MINNTEHENQSHDFNNKSQNTHTHTHTHTHTYIYIHLLYIYYLHQVLVEALRLSRSVACGILLPGPGIKPASPALQGGLNHWTSSGYKEAVSELTGPQGKSLYMSSL